VQGHLFSEAVDVDAATNLLNQEAALHPPFGLKLRAV
jgi:hypothetical protein